jgi:hypothetical protein
MAGIFHIMVLGVSASCKVINLFRPKTRLLYFFQLHAEVTVKKECDSCILLISSTLLFFPIISADICTKLNHPEDRNSALFRNLIRSLSESLLRASFQHGLLYREIII